MYIKFCGRFVLLVLGDNFNMYLDVVPFKIKNVHNKLLYIEKFIGLITFIQIMQRNKHVCIYMNS